MKNAMVSDTNCFELITPIFKDGLLDDPNNYRGLCVSSALLKVTRSLIKKRLQKFIDKNNLLSKNQIGFKKTKQNIRSLTNSQVYCKKTCYIG